MGGRNGLPVPQERWAAKQGRNSVEDPGKAGDAGRRDGAKDKRCPPRHGGRASNAIAPRVDC
ncbi:MAG: hypothetical protein NVS3B5_01000 [Sphingomicrobium sp.]